MAKKPKIWILTTGGTIAGSAENSANFKYKSGKISPSEILKFLPKICEIAEIKCEEIANIGSQDMNFKIWINLANRINEILQNDADGVVITHGSDTMEETAYFLNLVVKSKKPVVLTGAMRPQNAISADGAGNLYHAIKVASSKISHSRGVLVVLNGEIHAAREVCKIHTNNLNAFSSPNNGKIGVVDFNEVKFYLSVDRVHTFKSHLQIHKINEFAKVEIIYLNTQNSHEILNFVIKNGVKALIIATLGNGNFDKKTGEILTKAAQNGVIIALSSRVGSGVVTGAEIETKNFILTDNLNPQKARVLLLLALLKTKNLKEIQKIFDTY